MAPRNGPVIPDNLIAGLASCPQDISVRTPGSVRGNEFVRRIQALGRERAWKSSGPAHRGKGSHGLLYYGSP